ncbi:MAG: vitamin K epoxide reductase family protein [Actinobacteria bacterium]|nr:MAG: vitamin K epoxide reductase family protein [Actinomycetota bacterium]
MLVSSLLGLVASLVLSIDAVALAADPNADLSCNINSKISCGAVGTTWQANLLGFPNAFIGLIAEPVVITLATAALGGVRFPRWFMLTAQAVYSIGFVFALWLFYQAYFVIGALCPWCLLITVTTTLVFTSMTRVNLLDGNLGPRLQRWARTPLNYLADVAGTLIFIAILAAMVMVRYM